MNRPVTFTSTGMPSSSLGSPRTSARSTKIRTAGLPLTNPTAVPTTPGRRISASLWCPCAAMAAWMSGACPSMAADGPVGKSETLSEQADQRNAPSAMAARAAAPCVMRRCVMNGSRLGRGWGRRLHYGEGRGGGQVGKNPHAASRASLLPARRRGLPPEHVPRRVVGLERTGHRVNLVVPANAGRDHLAGPQDALIRSRLRDDAVPAARENAQRDRVAVGELHRPAFAVGRGGSFQDAVLDD